MEDKEMEKGKVIIDDPRTIYSLSMVVILYELGNNLNPDILPNQGNSLFNTLLPLLIDPLKTIFQFLIVFQVLFLLMRGLSLADISDEYRTYLLYLSDRVYASGFQFSLIIIPIIGASLAILSITFDYLIKIPIKLWVVFLFILIPVFIAVISWKVLCWKNNAACVELQTPPKRIKRKWLWNNFTNVYVFSWAVVLALFMIYFFLKSAKLF